MRGYSEIVPVVSFATMPPFFVGRSPLRKEISEIRVCSSLILSRCFISETTQRGFDCICIRAVHKSLSGEFDFGPYQSGGTVRGTHYELFNLPSPNWPIVNVYSFKNSRFHGCVMTQTGRLGYDTTQSGTSAPTVTLEEHAASVLPVQMNAASFSEAVFTYELHGATSHKTSV
jgi:hypothetical protein